MTSHEYHDVPTHQLPLESPPRYPVTEGYDVFIFFGMTGWHDVIKWKLFPRYYWPFARGIHRSPVISPHKSQRRGALIFFICAWTNCWVNNRDASNLRRHRAHYNVTVMNKLLKTGRIPQDLGLWRSYGVTVMRFIRAFWLMSVTHM